MPFHRDTSNQTPPCTYESTLRDVFLHSSMFRFPNPLFSFKKKTQAVLYPQIIQTEYLAGHQLGTATWSNSMLTLLTTNQIIAELGWAREAVRQITGGVAPMLVRPPSGDVDDRVRAIVKAMNMTIVMPDGADMVMGDAGVLSGDDPTSLTSPEGVLEGFEMVVQGAVGGMEGIIAWT